MKILNFLCFASLSAVTSILTASVEENEGVKIKDQVKNLEDHQKEFKMLANELNVELKQFIQEKLPQKVLQMDKLYQKCTEMQKNFIKREDNKQPTSEFTTLAQEVGEFLTDLMIEMNLLESKQLKLHCNVKLQAETLLSDELGRLLEISQRLRNQASHAQLKMINVQRDRISWVRQLIKYPELGDQMLVEYDRGVLGSMRLGCQDNWTTDNCLANCRNEAITLHGALGTKVVELLTTENGNSHNTNNMNGKQNSDALATSISYIYN